MIRVAVVDDNEFVRQGLVDVLRRADDVRVVGTGASAAEARRVVDDSAPDVLLLDVRMPGGSGLEVLPTVPAATRVLMLTSAEDDATVLAALEAGAAGYLVHGTFDADRLLAAVRTVADGGSVLSDEVTATVLGLVRGGLRVGPPRDHGLTARELEVMACLTRGLDNATTARELGISRKTVKNHVTAILAKLDVQSRTEAVAHWLGGTTGTADPEVSDRTGT